MYVSYFGIINPFEFEFESEKNILNFGLGRVKSVRLGIFKSSHNSCIIGHPNSAHKLSDIPPVSNIKLFYKQRCGM